MTPAEKYVAPTMVALIAFVCGLHFGFNGYAVIAVLALITGYCLDRLIESAHLYREATRRYRENIKELETLAATLNTTACYKHSDMELLHDEECPKPGSLFPLSAAC